MNTNIDKLDEDIAKQLEEYDKYFNKLDKDIKAIINKQAELKKKIKEFTEVIHTTDKN